MRIQTFQTPNRIRFFSHVRAVMFGQTPNRILRAVMFGPRQQLPLESVPVAEGPTPTEEDHLSQAKAIPELIYIREHEEIDMLPSLLDDTRQTLLNRRPEGKNWAC